MSSIVYLREGNTIGIKGHLTIDLGQLHLVIDKLTFINTREENGNE
jgi:hypothetical protein